MCTGVCCFAGRVDVGGRWGKHVHLREEKSQDMGLAGTDGGDVSSDSA